ncbi:hypothetical protein L3Q82_005906 [Scortum barcoo]|uniref:Uncharacterized protein n=1 Tax=Scortum barcoo TaxID=214431 RepID=A0ACB8V7B6_9TELE|nr:hypothetical protein L3Q82_005906 [Scortum barcoo]
MNMIGKQRMSSSRSKLPLLLYGILLCSSFTYFPVFSGKRQTIHSARSLVWASSSSWDKRENASSCLLSSFMERETVVVPVELIEDNSDADNTDEDDSDEDENDKDQPEPKKRWQVARLTTWIKADLDNPVVESTSTLPLTLFRLPSITSAGLLEISPVERGVVTLFGVRSGLFIAMSDKGKLYGSGHYNDECKFKENLLANNYNAYESAAYPGMYIGLSKTGKAKRGNRVTPVMTMTHFLPRI